MSVKVLRVPKLTSFVIAWASLSSEIERRRASIFGSRSRGKLDCAPASVQLPAGVTYAFKRVGSNGFEMIRKDQRKQAFVARLTVTGEGKMLTYEMTRPGAGQQTTKRVFNKQ